jgi:sarcosine oxidase, subunit alpha
MSSRLSTGGLIDRTKPLTFTFDGKSMMGFEGDSVASALMASGVDVIARSFKYHRPRGFFGAGSEEPNAIVTIGTGAKVEPNLVATQVPLTDGMMVASQNRWPNLKWDVGAINGLIAPLLPSGFYYKTFMWPAWAWKHYEHVIRNAAGFGEAPGAADPDTYGKRYRHGDVLVIGAGPSGLKAARDAAQTGGRVILCDEGPAVDETWAELGALENITLLPATTVFGWYDHNYVLAVTRHGASEGDSQTLQKIRVGKVILASGAIERSLLFTGNDRPGVMLCSAARRYINRYAVRPGNQAVIYTNNDTGYDSVAALRKAGITINALIDRRDAPSDQAQQLASDAGIEVLTESHIAEATGRSRVKAVTVISGKTIRKIPCDLVCVSGGWTPTTHLYSQMGGKLHFDEGLQTLVASSTSGDGFEIVGAAAEGVPEQGTMATDWLDTANDVRRTKTFVDLQNDVTAADLALAVREGYGDVELAKRYTTTGMGTDQGKTSNVHAIGLLAELTGRSPNDVGHTTFRAPYTPVTFGAAAGHEVGAELTPLHRTPFHTKHVETGVVFEPSSSWLYPKYYPRGTETIDEAITREVINTRKHVGVVDMSTLGKVELCGPDVIPFLELAYINKFAKLAVGRCRYGLILRPDGMVLDDGTVTRIADDRYLITMTTAQSWLTQLHLEKLLQVDYPHLDVVMLPVTEQWASLAVAGPRARDVLDKLSPDFHTTNDDFPFTHYREGTLAGLPVRVFRVSFSGELCYEINVGANSAGRLWDAVMEAGAPLGIMPYGLEALDVMRIEKGHLNVGTEIDGRTTPDDLGLGRMAKTDGFFVGQPLLDRKDLNREDRLQLVGLRPVDGKTMIPRGSIIVDGDTGSDILGHETATVFSPTLGHPIALALVAGGRARMERGDALIATSPVERVRVPVMVCSPVFEDANGEKLRA